MFLEEPRRLLAGLRRRQPDPNVGSHLPPPPAPPTRSVSISLQAAANDDDAHVAPANEVPSQPLALVNRSNSQLSNHAVVSSSLVDDAALMRVSSDLALLRDVHLSKPLEYFPIPVEKIFASPRGTSSVPVHPYDMRPSMLPRPPPNSSALASAVVPFSAAERQFSRDPLELLEVATAQAERQMDALDLWFSSRDAAGDASGLSHRSSHRIRGSSTGEMRMLQRALLPPSPRVHLKGGA